MVDQSTGELYQLMGSCAQRRWLPFASLVRLDDPWVRTKLTGCYSRIPGRSMNHHACAG